jgi:hypothetical protein
MILLREEEEEEEVLKSTDSVFQMSVAPKVNKITVLVAQVQSSERTG